jgi:hypothetical protein
MTQRTNASDQTWFNEEAAKLERKDYELVLSQGEVESILVNSLHEKPIHACQDANTCECKAWVALWYSLYYSLPLRTRTRIESRIMGLGETYPWAPGFGVRW